MKLPTKKVFFQHSINFLGFTLFCFLLNGEISYYMSKPTHSSNTKKRLKPEHFPDLIICPFPGFDLEKLEKYGYMSSFHFMTGNISNIKVVAHDNVLSKRTMGL